MSDYETGYANGESSLSADIDYHLNENCGQPDGDDRNWTEYTSWLWAEVQRFHETLVKLKEWVDDEGWCPICDEHHCRQGNCVLAEFECGVEEDEYDYAEDDLAFDAAREDAFFRR